MNTKAIALAGALALSTIPMAGNAASGVEAGWLDCVADGSVGGLNAVLVMLGLGTWQLDRLQWKTDLIEEITSRTTAEPVPLPALLSKADGTLGSIQYRRVRLTGTFLHDAEMYLAARSMNGRTPSLPKYGFTVSASTGLPANKYASA